MLALSLIMIDLLIKLRIVLKVLNTDIVSTQETLQHLCEILKGSWFF